MLNLLYITFSFITFGLYNLYIFDNVKIMGEGSSSIEILIIIFILSIILISYQAIKVNKIIIKKSFFILLLFFTYVVIRITLDTQDINLIKSYLISTTGGIVLFYFLGSFLILILNYFTKICIKSKQVFSQIILMFFIFLLYNSYMILDAFLYLLDGMRTDVFLLTNADDYQRPANFLIINFIFMSILFVHILLLSYYQKRFKITIFVSSIIFYINMVASITLSQLIGSNNATVTIFGILFLNIVMQVFLLFQNNKIVLKSLKFKFKSLLFGILSRKIYKSIFIVSSIILTIGTFFMINTNIEFSSFRIFGFGSDELSSVTSRLKLLDNFSTQFNFSPIFGNIIVDKLTTGNGSYVHSTIASLLTHLGLIGFSIFFIYIFIAFREFYKLKDDKFIENGLKTYLTLLFLGIFLIALVGTFFIWTPLWFLLGTIFGFISFKNIPKNNKEKKGK